MSRLLVLLLLPLALYGYWKYFSKAPPELRSKRLKQAALLGGGLLLTALLLRGGSYAGAITTLLLTIAARVLPQLIATKLQPPPQTPGEPAPRPEQMTRARASQILGVSEQADRAEVLSRYKELMKRNHPDRGGSTHIAAQINQAKDVLLKGLE
jgi:hypothetical protein